LNGKTVSHKLDILAHEFCIHTNQFTWQGFRNEVLLNLHGLTNNVMGILLAEFVLDLAVQQTRKLSVQTLITRNQFIALRQSWLQTTLLEPLNRAEGSTEEYAFHD
jgi:hypothetical protein